MTESEAAEELEYLLAGHDERLEWAKAAAAEDRDRLPEYRGETTIHLNLGAGITACAVAIPDLWPDHKWWMPEHGGESPVTCEYCLRGEPAPLCMLSTEALRRLEADNERLRRTAGKRKT